MEDIHDFDKIDVELDAYFKKKQVSRCKDKFISTLCEEDDDEAVDDAQIGINKEDSDEDYREGSNEEDSDEEAEYSTHNQNVKWNKMRPMLGERPRLEPELLNWSRTKRGSSGGGGRNKDEKKMGAKGINEEGMDEKRIVNGGMHEEVMDGEGALPITQQLNQVGIRPAKRRKVNQVKRRKP
ncbi:unnamed protein product [Lactuca saligna]|uniref:Uncharacterized protein n=1 Tax=Lactuca saligna TaxID=75948 RepID=A0AA36DZH7_LACSI|nr:unnamed protein product [Lactuca saligna]